MIYRVTKKYGRGSETNVGQFKTLNESKTFIQKQLADDALHKISSIYTLYEGFDLIEEFDQSTLDNTASSEDEGSSGQQRGSSQTFSPTPFSTTPQPKGMPRSWVKDEDDKKDQK